MTRRLVNDGKWTSIFFVLEWSNIENVTRSKEDEYDNGQKTFSYGTYNNSFIATYTCGSKPRGHAQHKEFAMCTLSRLVWFICMSSIYIVTVPVHCSWISSAILFNFRFISLNFDGSLILLSSSSSPVPFKLHALCERVHVCV